MESCLRTAHRRQLGYRDVKNNGLISFIVGDRLRSTTAISCIFSKIEAFFNLGSQLVILTLHALSITLQLLHL